MLGRHRPHFLLARRASVVVAGMKRDADDEASADAKALQGEDPRQLLRARGEISQG